MKVSNIEGARSNNTSCEAPGWAQRPRTGTGLGQSTDLFQGDRSGGSCARAQMHTRRDAAESRNGQRVGKGEAAPPRPAAAVFLSCSWWCSRARFAWCGLRRAKAPKQERIYRKVRRGFTVLPLDGTGPFALVCLCSARVFGDMAGVGSEMERRIGTHGRADGRGEAVRSEYSLPATGIIPRVPCGSFRAPDRRVTACPSPRAPSHRPQHGPHGRRATQAHRHPHRKKARQPAHLDPPLFFSSRRSGDFGCASPFQRP
jgi:hypothetical protein